MMQATTTILRSILLAIDDDSLESTRDRAILALRIAGAFQMSELATLTFSKIKRSDNSLEIRLGNWGNNKASRRNVLTIMDDTILQPVALLDDWLVSSRLQAGRLFRQISGNRVTSTAMAKSDILAAIQSRALAAGYSDEVLSRIKARKSSVHTVSLGHTASLGL